MPFIRLKPLNWLEKIFASPEAKQAWHDAIGERYFAEGNYQGWQTVEAELRTDWRAQQDAERLAAKSDAKGGPWIIPGGR